MKDLYVYTLIKYLKIFFLLFYPLYKLNKVVFINFINLKASSYNKNFF